MSAPEHRGRQPQLYGGVAKFITWSVVFIIFIIAPLLSAFSVKPRMLSSGQDIEARVFAVFECRRVPCRNPWDTKRATAGSSGGAELCRILLVSQREINVLGERRPRHADFDGASARALHRRGGWALFFSTTDLRSAFGTELLDLTVGPRQTVTPRRPHCSVGVDDLAVGRSVD